MSEGEKGADAPGEPREPFTGGGGGAGGIQGFFALVDRLPVLKSEKRPSLAAAIGLVFGGIGLGLYFRSFVDFIIPTSIAILAAIVLAVVNSDLVFVGVIGGAIVASLWGYLRALSSNDRLA